MTGIVKKTDDGMLVVEHDICIETEIHPDDIVKYQDYVGRWVEFELEMYGALHVVAKIL